MSPEKPNIHVSRDTIVRPAHFISVKRVTGQRNSASRLTSRELLIPYRAEPVWLKPQFARFSTTIPSSLPIVVYPA